MGVVTVFAIDGCPFCDRAKKNLSDRNIPYTEINLSSYPDKRSDMLSLSDSLTVPQIFFNEKHIGGATETIALLEQWDTDGAFATFESEVQSKPNPTDPKLQPSTLPPKKESVSPPRNEDDAIKLPSKTTITILEMTERLIKIIPKSDLGYLGKTYKNCATGKSIVESLRKDFFTDSDTDTDVIEFGQYLQKKKLLHHVRYEHDFSNDNNLFFRLQPYQTPDVMNSYRIWTDRVDTDSISIVARLNKSMQGIQKRSMITITTPNKDDGEGEKKNDGNVAAKATTTTASVVDLSLALQDEKYIQFEEEICELQGVNMSSMEDNEKTAFIINVYNLMIKYAQIKYGVPGNAAQRSSFFGGIKINIGNDLFSFSELENGILRANSKAPYSLSKPFANKGDNRLKLSLEKVDNRIHFALNCGAQSCPPVKKFTATDLQEELRIVASAFCEQDDNIRIIDTKENSELCLNMIFKWYGKDFASSTNELPSTIVNYLRGQRKETLQKMIDSKTSIKVKFNTYDWNAPVTNGKQNDISDLKADQYQIIKSIFGGGK